MVSSTPVYMRGAMSVMTIDQDAPVWLVPDAMLRPVRALEDVDDLAPLSAHAITLERHIIQSGRARRYVYVEKGEPLTASLAALLWRGCP